MGYKISAIINTYNEKNKLERIVRNLLNQTIRVDEIIIVDGGSTDGSIESAINMSKQYKNIRTISGQRLNIAQGFNAGIKSAHNDLFFLTSTGNSFPENLVEHLLRTMIKNNADAVSPLIKAAKNNTFTDNYGYVFLNRGKVKKLLSK